MSVASRLLLLLPTTTYRTEAFVAAATKLGVELVCASERPEHARAPGSRSARHARLRRSSGERRDDRAVRAAAADRRRRPRGRPHHGRRRGHQPSGSASRPTRCAAVATARDKHAMRRRLAEAGVRSAALPAGPAGRRPRRARARTVDYPCVLKPLALSASRGVIRADDAARVRGGVPRASRAILDAPRTSSAAGEARRAAARRGVHSRRRGRARGAARPAATCTSLALFDKPDPLDGPFFEETIYVTPVAPARSASSGASRRRRATACAALGLDRGAGPRRAAR